ncbi:hypothetical protein STIAU_4841 [Stigmatella aurantiaca DW4/3-1]|uniref:AMIN domain-containing protein n=1 Tax=Stigmatella aurantiaca (strain DW4/3-1) TaxID=378806 RepID=Q08ZU5_STIAD|nr:hypothetical protein STIAU_4841 [Stigmatella aurantiaca DW4/3-1]
MVEITGSQKPSFTTFTMTDPPRLVIDISGAVLSGVPEEIPARGGGVTGLRTANYGSESTAVARVLIGYERDVETDIQVSNNVLFVKVLEEGSQAVAQARPFESAQAPSEGRDTEAAAPPDAAQASEAARAEREAQAKAAAQASEAARVEREAQAKAAAQVEETRRREQETAAAEKQRQTEAEAKRQAEAKQREETARAQAEARKAAEDEEKRRQAEEAQAKRQAETEAKQRKQEEARAQAEARRTAEAEEKQRQKEEAEARRQAEVEAKQRKQEEARAQAEARRSAQAEETRRQQETARVASAEPPAREEQGDSAAAPGISARRKTLEIVGFQQRASSSRVYIRTNERVQYKVSQSDREIILELENTQIGKGNNTRALDTSFFDTAVSRVDPLAGPGRSVRVSIRLKEPVSVQTRQEGNTISLDFPRSAER